MDKKYMLVGFLRGLGIVILMAVLSYIGMVDNLAWLNPTTATILSAAALALEHVIESSTGRALFGAVQA